jgi:hypothetical protein
MERIEKTVFISYRRTNVPWALAIYQHLTHHGYDVFFDYTGIASGDFERVILGNIAARAHFLVLLTPSTLERCSEPADWLRREIEAALDARCNMVPLMLEGFDFGTPTVASQLTGRLVALKRYNALSVPAEYFMEAMDRLRNRYLNVPLDAVLHPASPSAQRVATEQKVAVERAPTVKGEELIRFSSCFISYSSKDRDFAERLYADLQARGVRCWFAQEDLKTGDRFQEQIDQSIRLFDKAIVILSAESIQSRWVEHEVNAALERESRENRSFLFPIRIDDAVMKGPQPWAADLRRSRHIADFRGWTAHASYVKAFERLLRDVRATSHASEQLAANEPAITSSRVIGNILYVEASGCESCSQHFDIAIPDAKRLDTGHQGLLPGIEFQETTHVGRAGVRNVIFNGLTLSFDIFAEGAGTIQGGGQINGPFGIKINNPIPRTCVGAAGASYGVKIVAFYR